MLSTSSPSTSPSRSPNRAIAFLAVASFASQAMVRSVDSLLPQIAADVGTTVGTASIVVTAYAITHGTIQLIIGPVGDRMGKYRAITLACALSAIMVAICGLAQSLTTLAIARLCSGATAAWIVPLSIAFIGDVVPYERRHQVLGTFLSGQIAGALVGQAAGGVIGDHFGWRSVFFALSALFVIATVLMAYELTTNPLTRSADGPGIGRGRLVADYRTVLTNPWARFVLLITCIEGALMWGIFTYIGADLHLRFGLSFTAIGFVVAAVGIGGIAYSLTVRPLTARFGPIGMTRSGGVMMGIAFLTLAVEPVWWFAPAATAAIGFGFYMQHNMLQTVSTQMSPEARGTAIGLFSSVFYIGQSIGAALAAPVVDQFGAPPAFMASAVLLPILAFWFTGRLQRR
jgi:MFS transporter, YNFM family, putative membrane transport protein